MFVGDLDPNVSDEILREVFSQNYPSVSSAKVIIDQNTKRSKCYGFIKFKNWGEFDRALQEMNGKFIFSRPIKVNPANKKMPDNMYTNASSSNSNTAYANFSTPSPNSNSSSASSSVGTPTHFTIPQFNPNKIFYPKEYTKDNSSFNLFSNQQFNPPVSFCNYSNSNKNCNLFNYYNFYIQTNLDTNSQYFSDKKNMFSYYYSLISSSTSEMENVNNCIQYSKYGYDDSEAHSQGRYRIFWFINSRKFVDPQ